MTSTQPESIWTPTFALLCLAQFLGYAQHFILTPTFPLYVTDLGGSPFVVGLVLGSFAITSVVFRPMIGHWADRWNAVGVMITGLVGLIISMLFCFIPRVEMTMLANGLRGIGWAGLNTGGYTLLALSAPESRRGEASGYYSGVQSSATIFFPAVALWLIQASFGGFTVVFGVAVGLALAGTCIGMLMRGYLPHTAQPERSAPSLEWRQLFNFFDRDVWLPSALLFCLNLSLPAVTSFIVLYAREIQIQNFAWYFVVSGVTSLLARPFLGRVSDKIGRGPSLAAGFILQIAALAMLVTVTHLPGVLISGILYMMGNAIGSATTLALAVERANPQRRGKAMATFSVAYPLSYGVASLVTGSAVEIAGYIGMFLLVAGLESLGVAVVLGNWSDLKKGARGR
ncbi:MAG TPA: MFS transporter [Terriglobales bacterium]|nr:MFS transporter [Terriglobales bacterium]